MAQQVTAWAATDGSIHLTENAANKIDAALAVEGWIEEQGIGDGGDWSGDMVLRCLLDDVGVIAPLLVAYGKAKGAL